MVSSDFFEDKRYQYLPDIKAYVYLEWPDIHDDWRIKTLGGRPVVARSIRVDDKKPCADCGKPSRWIVWEVWESESDKERIGWNWCGTCSVGG